MISPSPSGQDRAAHDHPFGRAMCVRCNPGWHVIPDPSNAIMGCDDCGHARQMHSREPGIGCLHVEPHWSGPLCPCLRAGTSEADQYGDTDADHWI